MTENTSSGQGPVVPAFSAAALDEWSRTVENILRGIAHALNNRASAISAVMELAAEPDDDPSVTRSILATELERVTELASVVRCVGAPRSGGSEALAPADVAEEALAVLRLHAEQRDRVIMIEAHGAPPVRVPRWMLLRALIALAATASPADDRTRTVRITAHQDGEWLTVRVADARGAARSSYATELAAGMGGGATDDGCGFRVPTLAALRRREGR